MNWFGKRKATFIGLDDIVQIGSRNGAAAIIYEDGRREVVMLPMNYELTWMTDSQHLHDGRLTALRLGWQLPISPMKIGVGLGQQDITVASSKNTMQPFFGLGSVAMIEPALEVDDPRFDQKCRFRGIDPDQVRRQRH